MGSPIRRFPYTRHAGYPQHDSPCEYVRGRCVYCGKPQSTRGNVRVEWNGVKFRSMAEMRYARDVLEPLRRGGVYEAWRYEPMLELRDSGTGILITRHRVDFRVLLPDGRVELHEVKGHEEDAWLLKEAILRACYLPLHPEVTYHVIDSKTLKPKMRKERRRR